MGPFFDEKFFGHLLHDLALFTVRATGELLVLVGCPDQVTEDYVPAVEALVAIQRGTSKSPGQR